MAADTSGSIFSFLSQNSGQSAGSTANYMGMLNGAQSFMGSQEAAAASEEGAAMQAAGYRQAGNSAIELAKYNSQIISANLGQQLGILARTEAATRSTQTAQMGASGIDIGSKSYLALANDTINSFSRQQTQAKLNAEVQKRGVMFDAELSQTAYENQARAAQYSGALASSKAKSQGTMGLMQLGMSAYSAYSGGGAASFSK